MTVQCRYIKLQGDVHVTLCIASRRETFSKEMTADSYQLSAVSLLPLLTHKSWARRNVPMNPNFLTSVLMAFLAFPAFPAQGRPIGAPLLPRSSGTARHPHREIHSNSL